MVMLQLTARSRVVAKPQVVGSLNAKNAHPCRWCPPQEGGSTKYSPNKGEVGTIFGGPREFMNSQCTQDKYALEARAPLYASLQTINNSSLRGIMPKPEGIVFTETDTSYMHHPHEDTLVIAAKIANSLIH